MTATGLPVDSATLARNLRAMPSLPPVVLDLIHRMQRNERVDDIASTLSLDQALSAKVLQLSNSPFYGLSGRVGSISDGVKVLGLNQLSCLVVAATVTLQFAQLHCKSLHLDIFWRHSIACAVAARQLAQQQGIDSASAFTAGLLHDIGRLAADSLYPYEMAQAVAWATDHDQPDCEAEQYILQMCHPELGAEICRNWHFRDDVVDAIAGHHAPDTAPTAPLRDVIHAANAIAHALDVANDPMEAAPAVSHAVWQRLALTSQQLAGLLATIEHEFEELTAVLSPGVPTT